MSDFIKSFLFLLYILAVTGCSNKGHFDKEEDVELIASALGAKSLAEMISLEAVFGRTVVVKNNSVKFEISREQEKINNGVRSEVSINYPFKEAEEIIYSFEIFIPNSFKSDPSGRWSSLAQWHDQPDPALGETWSTFPGRSPLVLVFDKLIDDNQVFGLNYGDQSVELPLIIGKWNKLQFHFKWSTDSNGFLVLNVNDGTEFKFYGGNMHNKYQHYLKIGLYRHPQIFGSNHVYYRNLNIHSKN